MKKNIIKMAFLVQTIFLFMFLSACNQKAKTTTKEFSVLFGTENNSGGKVTARIEGSKEITTGEKVAEGKTVVFTAIPDNGYDIKMWKGIADAALGATTAKAVVKGDLDVKAVFISKEYTVKFANEGAGGKVTAAIKGGKAIVTGEKVAEGKTVVFTAVPDNGYDVKMWKGADASPADSKTVEITINKDIDVKVVFISKEYTIKFTNEGAGGKVTAAIKGGKAIVTGEKVPAGKTVVFTAVPDKDYDVKLWAGISVTPSDSKTAEVVVNNDIDVKVVFFKNITELQITGDANINITNDAGKDYATLVVPGNSTWASIKAEAQKKASVKDSANFELCLWKIADEVTDEGVTRGVMLKDDYVFRSSVKIKAISIPKAQFVKTSDATVKIDGKADNTQGPWYNGAFWNTRKIKLNPYNIGRTEVTYQLWYAVRVWGEAHGYEFKNLGVEDSLDGKKGNNIGNEPTFKSDNPVVFIYWADCIPWCNAYTEMKKGEASCVYKRLSTNGAIIKKYYDTEVGRDNPNSTIVFMDKSKDGFRLPTEAEWEFAARYQGNGSDAKHKINAEEYGSGVWLTKLGSASGAADNTFEETKKFAWLNVKMTHPVGKLQPNALGLYDMCGNAYEWCFDFFDMQPGSTDNNHKDSEGYVLSPVLDNKRGALHVLRGGCFEANIENAKQCSVGFRTQKGDATYNRGFRLVFGKAD